MEPIHPSVTQGAVSPFRRPPRSTSPFPRPRAAAFGPVPAAPLTSSAPAAAPARPEARAATGLDREALERRRNGGASWFYWVAALSLINSVGALTGQGWRFIVGLGITQLADALVARTGHGLALVAPVDVALIGGFALLGRYARRGRLWAFGVGAAFYALDGLIFVAARDWIGVAFHAFVLVMAARGFEAARRLA
jgi:hypothetical protein